MLLFELKTPGVGIWAIGAAVFGTLFLLCQFYLELVGHWEIIALALGIGLIIVDIVFAVGAGAFAISGLVLILIALVLSFMPDAVQFDPTNEQFGAALSQAFLNSLLAMSIIVAGVIMFVITLPKSPLLKRLANNGELLATNTSGLAQHDTLIGVQAITSEDLHPQGRIAIEGRWHSALAEHGAYIAAGQTVEIIEKRFGDLVLRPLSVAASTGTAASDSPQAIGDQPSQPGSTGSSLA